MNLDIPTGADPRWQSVLSRDPDADGRFWYSVSTTMIYCRPSCPSRTARPENVRIHDSIDAARSTGARACRRCNPDGSSRSEQDAAIVEQACRAIEASETAPALADLAYRAELSPSHFHRLFKSIAGVTPKGYADAVRARRVRDGLAGDGSVTDAIYAAGFGSSGRFYETSTRKLGMTPTSFRSGGTDEILRFAVGACSLGAILVAMSDRGIASILLGEDPGALVRDLQDRFPNAELVGADAAFEAVVARVVAQVEAPGASLGLPLDVRGTAFQQRVWQALSRIPAGTTASYGEIARNIGAPNSTRAVAAACAANRLAVAIPCHRVVRTDGGLSGYRWGVERKRELLRREAAA